ncbi:MAG: hybrid sensor histidine kinase/response regulator [Verrucomicrobiales bacterium]|nr:hybrid sensor histidine kinase/response regulator [Verrucomicrobiales bacterium]
MNPLPAGETSIKTRILVVDDITRNLQVIGTMLLGAGYEVMPTNSGARALERVRIQLPDLVLLDLMMPEMDGIEVCRRLQEDPLTARIPVIFLTASTEMEHLVRGFEVGAVDYVTKPFNPPELLARVRTHVELRQARERLREMNDEKNEFLGIAAHDLRSPLNAIKGYSELLLEDGDFEAADADILKKICDAATRMAGMVQNLLDANRIERGELRPTLVPTDLGEVTATVVEAQRPRAAAKEQSLQWFPASEPVVAMADRAILVQVLENLASNAVKYSPPGKPIRVRVIPREAVLRIEVQDEGPGLSAEDQKRLFGKFARLSARPTGGESSTGLGLSIVKRMVEAMNGRVGCESEPGRGATFFVEMPRLSATLPNSD